jgi:hypothetical protein
LSGFRAPSTFAGWSFKSAPPPPPTNTHTHPTPSAYTSIFVDWTPPGVENVSLPQQSTQRPGVVSLATQCLHHTHNTHLCCVCVCAWRALMLHGETTTGAFSLRCLNLNLTGCSINSIPFFRISHMSSPFPLTGRLTNFRTI